MADRVLQIRDPAAHDLVVQTQRVFGLAAKHVEVIHRDVVRAVGEIERRARGAGRGVRGRDNRRRVARLTGQIRTVREHSVEHRRSELSLPLSLKTYASQGLHNSEHLNGKAKV